MVAENKHSLFSLLFSRVAIRTANVEIILLFQLDDPVGLPWGAQLVKSTVAQKLWG